MGLIGVVLILATGNASASAIPGLLIALNNSIGLGGGIFLLSYGLAHLPLRFWRTATWSSRLERCIVAVGRTGQKLEDARHELSQVGKIIRIIAHQTPSVDVFRPLVDFLHTKLTTRLAQSEIVAREGFTGWSTATMTTSSSPGQASTGAHGTANPTASASSSWWAPSSGDVEDGAPLPSMSERIPLRSIGSGGDQATSSSGKSTSGTKIDRNHPEAAGLEDYELAYGCDRNGLAALHRRLKSALDVHDGAWAEYTLAVMEALRVEDLMTSVLQRTPPWHSRVWGSWSLSAHEEPDAGVDGRAGHAGGDGIMRSDALDLPRRSTELPGTSRATSTSTTSTGAGTGTGTGTVSERMTSPGSLGEGDPWWRSGWDIAQARRPPPLWVKRGVWMFRCYVEPPLRGVVAVGTGLASLSVVFAEATIATGGRPDLSALSWWVRGSHTPLRLAIAVVAPLAYMMGCVTYSLFKMALLKKWYYLAPQASGPFSLLLNGVLLLRFMFPICYNYLNCVHLDDHTTAFEVLMKSMDHIPFFGGAFNVFYPLVGVLFFCFVVAQQLGQTRTIGKTLSAATVLSFDSFEETDNEFLDLGRLALSQERTAVAAGRPVASWIHSSATARRQFISSTTPAGPGGGGYGGGAAAAFLAQHGGQAHLEEAERKNRERQASAQAASERAARANVLTDTGDSIKRAWGRMFGRKEGRYAAPNPNSTPGSRAGGSITIATSSPPGASGRHGEPAASPVPWPGRGGVMMGTGTGPGPGPERGTGPTGAGSFQWLS